MKITGAESRLLALQDREDMQMWVTCVWCSKAGFGGPTLWPEQMLALSNLNLECGFDLYYFSDEQDQGLEHGSCAVMGSDLESWTPRWPEALELLKRCHGLSSSQCGLVCEGGDYVDSTGKIIGSLLDFVPADKRHRANSMVVEDAGDDAYPSCERTHAELRIYPGSGTTAEITEILGVEPTSRQDKETTFANSASRSWRPPLTGWFLSSENRVYSKDLGDHVDWLLVKMEGAKTALSELQEKAGTNMTVTCVWWSADGHGGPVLTPAQMHLFANLDLEFALDVYFFGNILGPAFGVSR